MPLTFETEEDREAHPIEGKIPRNLWLDFYAQSLNEKLMRLPFDECLTLLSETTDSKTTLRNLSSLMIGHKNLREDDVAMILERLDINDRTAGEIYFDTRWWGRWDLLSITASVGHNVLLNQLLKFEATRKATTSTRGFKRGIEAGLSLLLIHLAVYTILLPYRMRHTLWLTG